MHPLRNTLTGCAFKSGQTKPFLPKQFFNTKHKRNKGYLNSIENYSICAPSVAVPASIFGLKRLHALFKRTRSILVNAASSDAKRCDIKVPRIVGDSFDCASNIRVQGIQIQAIRDQNYLHLVKPAQIICHPVLE